MIGHFWGPYPTGRILRPAKFKPQQLQLVVSLPNKNNDLILLRVLWYDANSLNPAPTLNSLSIKGGIHIMYTREIINQIN